MAEITLVRHGQASFGADNYDQLSTTGYEQAVWLGDFWRQLDIRIDRIVMGTMERHRQTAEGILQGLKHDISVETHPGLNEYHFQGLLLALQERHAHLWQDTGNAKRDYFFNIRQAMTFWMSGEIADDQHDSWDGFCERAYRAFEFAHKTDATRTVIVSSGGTIAVMLGKILQYDQVTTRSIALQIKNSSCSNILYNGKDYTLDSFNDIAHLRTPERQSFITFS